MPKSRPLVVAAAAALSPRPEKHPDYFAQQVARLSHGALRVEIARGVLHESVPDTEGRLIEAPG